MLLWAGQKSISFDNTKTSYDEFDEDVPGWNLQLYAIPLPLYSFFVNLIDIGQKRKRKTKLKMMTTPLMTMMTMMTMMTTTLTTTMMTVKIKLKMQNQSLLARNPSRKHHAENNRKVGGLSDPSGKGSVKSG